MLGNNRVPGGALGTSDELVNITGAPTSPLDVDRILGAQGAFSLFKAVNINLSYLWMDSDNDRDVVGQGLFLTGANRLEVFGGDAAFTAGRFNFSGAYHESDLKADETGYVSNHAWAYDAKVAYTGSHYQLYALHREIQPNYIAPGDWGSARHPPEPGQHPGLPVRR